MLTRELLKKIRKIEITTARLVQEKLAGRYHSVFKGRGMAFSEVREYFFGDDVRNIDWNVSARNEQDACQALRGRERQDRDAARRHERFGTIRYASCE